MGKKGQKKARARKLEKSGKSISVSFSGVILNNVAAIVLVLLFLFVLYQTIPGYNWMWNNLVIANFQQILTYPDLTREQKLEIKCRFDYRYLNYISKNTPTDAVILFPELKTFFPEGQKSDFNNRGAWGVKNKAWSTYFLYPRKVVYEYERTSSPDYSRITHVAIVNGWGYERLNYAVSSKQKYHILPISAEGSAP